MLRHPIVAATLASAALISAFGLASRALAAPTVGTASVSPANLPAPGGTVTVQVTVTGTGFTRVRAAATTPGSRTAFGPAVVLTKVGTRYSGTLSVRANTQSTSQFSYIKIEAVDSRNRVMGTRQTGQVKVSGATNGGGGGGGGDTPPAPPPI